MYLSYALLEHKNACIMQFWELDKDTMQTVTANMFLITLDILYSESHIM